MNRTPDPSPRRGRNPGHPRITREASEWIARRDRGLAVGEQRALEAWLRADPRHAAEFARLGATWKSLDHTRHAPDLAALADEVLVRAHARRRTRRSWRQFATIPAAAAAIGLAGILGWTRFSPAAATRLPNETYRVLASTAERNVLPDGSVAELNGDSRIEVEFTAEVRRVRLARGEAHFTVAHNAERPFIVTAGPVSVRAVGTAFNVRLASERIEVLVTEGRVKLDERGAAAAPAEIPGPEAGQPLAQGQKAVVSCPPGNAAAAVSVGEVAAAEIDDELGWQSTRLVFNNTPLDEVIAGFNRYNQHQLKLGDPKLRQRALTGVFRADNLEGFVRLLRASADVTAERQGPSETVLRPVR